MGRNIGSALRALLVASSLTTSGASYIAKRALVTPSTLQGTWTSQGCFVDVGRTLTGGGYDDNAAMTDESCISYCSLNGFIYAGTEYSTQCYCGNTLASGSGSASTGDCNMACSGNATEACGGPNRLNLFWSGTSGPQTNPGAGNWTFSGCYTEGTTGRALTNGVGTTGGSTVMTVALCLSACQTAGYPLAGVEYSGECYCDNSVQNGGALATDGVTGCNMVCNGNFSEYCGGSSHLDLYDYKSEVSLPPFTTVSSTSTPASSSTSLPNQNGATSLTGSIFTSSGTVSSISTKSSSTTSTSKYSTSSSSSKSSTSTSSSKSSTSTSSSKSSTSTSSSKFSTSTSSSKSSTSTSSSKSSTSTSSSKSSTSTSTSKTSTSTSKSSTSTSKSSTSSTTSKSSTSTVVSTSKSSSTSSKPMSSSSVSSTSSTSRSSTSSSLSSSSITKSSPSSSVTSSSSTGNTVVSSTSSSATAAPTLGIKENIGAYAYQGCYTEATNSRALTGASFFNYTAMTLEMCAASCQGFTYWGVEYGGECYCGNALQAGSVVAADSDCSFTCPGNAYEYCGAGNRLDMYMVGTAAVSFSSTAAHTSTGTGTGTASIPATTTSSSISISSSAATGLPSGWAYYGCYVDGTNGRILQTQQPDNTASNTNEVCISTCASAGYTIAGTEYSVQCFCGNAIYNGGALAAQQSDCNSPCPGNSKENCGAGNRMSLYSIGIPQVYQAPGPQTSGLPAGWFYAGCLQDNTLSNEDVNSQSTQKETLHTLPWMISDISNNTIVGCIQQCAAYGYNAAGLEYGSQCFCGDQQNVLNASVPNTSSDPDDAQFFTYATPPQIVADSQCNVPCTGAAQYMCGAGNLLSYYIYNGTAVTSWEIPTGTNAGQYSLLIGGVVVPLITSQNVNGKVSFVEKSGTGEPNGTGAYELDLSQISNFNAAWRTMTGLQTDVFCSAGLTLPDRAGRQLTVGGWSGASNFGIRLYYPDGSPGTPGVNEWVESPSNLQLQTPRWYASAMIMANGSILVVGGEVNNNGNENPTLEILPPTGVPDASQPNGYSNTTVYLDFLEESWPFNLYPFITVVPSGIFIAYWNQARILDEETFQTIKTLPPIPGNVNDPTAGRTYQLEGAMVNLPQHYPYTDLTSVLICGGSTQGAGYAVDNCVSTQPEAPAPVWNIERMPSRRVMPCMAGLPDGTYVIVNGGQHGFAGFGLGSSPNLNAVLYDPSKPLNQRMSIMANTTVVRLYHSEAITLLDGRVMISGSDPTGDYNQPAGEFPEEYRVEVFTPPYLLSGLARPTFTLNNNDWSYTGINSTATFTLTSGSTANLQVSLLGSVVSTHGNAMGQRTLFPQVSCAGTLCTVTSPPSAHVAPPGWYMMFVLDGPTPSVGQFVRIGGDPANLGSWPNLPGFELPGTGGV